jgi:hypothetical protein
VAVVAAPSTRLAPPHRRGDLLTSERETLRFQLRRWRWWRESGRREDRWLASGVAQAIDYQRPLTKHHRPTGGYQPVAAPLDAGEGWLRVMDDAINGLHPHARQVVWWKAEDAGADVRTTIPVIAERLGCSERLVSAIWRQAAVQLVNELWPGSSGGFAR